MVMKKKNPKICILMATYNGEKYLEEQLNSLDRQKNVEIKILVRDDGSTDLTKSILEKWSEKTFFKWYTGKHMNAAEGFIDLVENAADADYYAFCDQDDVWDDDKLEIAVHLLCKEAAHIPQLYCSGSRLVDSNKNFISNHVLDVKRTQMARLFFSGIAGNTMVFNRALKQKICEYHPQYMKLHDTWVYKLCLCLGGKIIIDPKPHLDYRQHGSNVWGMETSFAKKIKKFTDIIKEKGTYQELMELYDNYYESITPEYKELLDTVKKCRGSVRSRLRLVCNPKIYFHNLGFDLAFRLKVLSNNL